MDGLTTNQAAAIIDAILMNEPEDSSLEVMRGVARGILIGLSVADQITPDQIDELTAQDLAAKFC